MEVIFYFNSFFGNGAKVSLGFDCCRFLTLDVKSCCSFALSGAKERSWQFIKTMKRLTWKKIFKSLT